MSSLDAIKDGANQIISVNSALKYFVSMHLVLILGIVGMSGFSKLDKILNQQIIVALGILFFVTFIVSFIAVLINPRRYLYTRLEWLQKEDLSDSTSKQKYRSAEEPEKNVPAPLPEIAVGRSETNKE